MNPLDGIQQGASSLASSQTGMTKARMDHLYKNPETFEQKKMTESSQEFEAIFFQQMLDEMDKTVHREDSLFGNSEGEKVFREMMNKEIAMSVATAPGGSGFGLAESIYRQMYINQEAESTGKDALNQHHGKTAPVEVKRVDTSG